MKFYKFGWKDGHNIQDMFLGEAEGMRLRRGRKKTLIVSITFYFFMKQIELNIKIC